MGRIRRSQHCRALFGVIEITTLIVPFIINFIGMEYEHRSKCSTFIRYSMVPYTCIDAVFKFSSVLSRLRLEVKYIS